MRQASYRTRVESKSPWILLRLGGYSSLLAGVLFVVWGYVHRIDAPWYLDVTATVLSYVVPALFFVALMGLFTVWRGRVGRIGKFGFVLGLAASAMGVVYAIPWWAFASRDDWLASLVWLDTPLVWWLHLLLIGIPLVGISAVRAGTLSGQGLLLLAIGVFGWVYYAADSGAILASRSVHVVFGTLFGFGWIALGFLLLQTETS